MEKEWQNKVLKGELTFQLLPQNQPGTQKLTLGNQLKECKASIIQAYLEKYVIDPQVTIIMDVGKWAAVKTGEAEVTHNGLKRILPRRVWVGPGVSAEVTRTSQIPWDMHNMRCGKCRMDGYMTWQCKNQVGCIKCRAKGYLAADCPYCETYL